jgi:hypothetical protein
MTDLEKMGEEALERAKALLTKAKGPDVDFEGYDEPELPEELDATDDFEDEEERAADHDEEGKVRKSSDAHHGEHDEDEEEEEEGDEAEHMAKPMVKAVDAVPILAAIEKRLRRVEALEKRLAYMVKALEALTTATKAMAKGYAALAEIPVKPKAHRAVVPTGARQPSAGELFSKALSVVKDPMRVAILEHFVNRGDVEGLLANLTPEERAKVLGGEA